MIDLILYYIILYITYITFLNHITNFTTLFIIVINFIIVIGRQTERIEPRLRSTSPPPSSARQSSPPGKPTQAQTS